MTHHVIKAHPPMYWAVKDGTKNFEVRKDDRAYQAGDTLEIVYHDPAPPAPFPSQPSFAPPFPEDIPSGVVKRKNNDTKPVFKKITFVLRGGQYGVEEGFVVLALADLPA